MMNEPTDKPGENKGEKKEEKMIQLTESQFQDYLKQLNDTHVRSLEVAKKELIEEFEKKVPKDPLGLDVYSPGIGKLVTAKINDGCIEGKVREVLAEGGMASDVIKDLAPGVLRGVAANNRELLEGIATESMKEQARKEAERAYIEIQDALDGVKKPRTLKEIEIDKARRRKSRRMWTKIGIIAGGVVIVAGATLSAFSMYFSSKRTAEGARGIAERAVAGLETYKKGAAQAQKDYDSEVRKAINESVAAERTDRTAKDGELEQRVNDRLATKVDLSALAAKMADVDKRYADLKAYNVETDGRMKALGDRDNALNQAYESYKAVVDELSKKLDKSAMKDYTDAEFARVKESVTGLGKKLSDYDAVVKTAESTGAANSAELRALRETSDKMRADCTALNARVSDLETYRNEKND